MKFKSPYTVAELAQWLGRKYIGVNQKITGFNEIHIVSSGDVTFVDHPKYYAKSLNSKASVIIINSESEPCPEGKALIISDDPFADFTKIIRHHYTFVASSTAISPTAQIGQNTVIQPNVFIGDYVKIGNNCIIHSNVSIYPYTEIGDNVIIHSSSVIGADGYYFQKKDGHFRKFESGGRVVIKNNVEIGASCTIDRGVTGDTTIGEGCKLDNLIQVGHDTVIGKNCLIGSQCAIAGVTRIEDDVMLWARVVINKDLVIGKGAVLYATSGVDKNIEGGKTYFGSPAQPIMTAWRELAAIRQLPKLIKELKKR